MTGADVRVNINHFFSHDAVLCTARRSVTLLSLLFLHIGHTLMIDEN